MSLGARTREILRRFRERNKPLEHSRKKAAEMERRLAEARHYLGPRYLLHPSRYVRRRTTPRGEG